MSSAETTHPIEWRFYCALVPYRFYPKSALKPAITQKQKWARFYRMQDRWGVVLDLRLRLERAAARSFVEKSVEAGHGE